MLNRLRQLAYKLPILRTKARLAQQAIALELGQAELDQQQAQLSQQQARLIQEQARLNQLQAELDQRWGVLESRRFVFSALPEELRCNLQTSVDDAPWKHPYLTTSNISRFRAYSESVWEFALEYSKAPSRRLKVAFLVNMNQNMYNWARLTQEHGAEVALFPTLQDKTALNCPEWEDFDGEFSEVMNGKAFLEANPHLTPRVPCQRIPMGGSAFYTAFKEFCFGNRRPLLTMLADKNDLRYEVLLGHEGFYPYYEWAGELSEFDTLYTTGPAFAAYASGRPYCALSFGGDLQYDAGRYDGYGQLTILSFGAARFLLTTNPLTLGHSRRLGLTNGVYLPYPMDDGRYCPGEGQARQRWEAQYGPGVYVLSTSRLDREAKGHSDVFFQALVGVAKQRPELRFIFLAWGNSADEFSAKVRESGLQDRFIILNPVGKKRLKDYYRSCDIVLDQFVFGYYGTTALEASAIGKPVIIRLENEQYAALYKGDTMPALSAATPDEVAAALLTLVDQRDFRLQNGREMRRWLVRNHGKERTVPLLLALLRITADRVPLPKDLASPLVDEESEAEAEYHRSCLRKTL